MALLSGKILVLNCGSSTIKGAVFGFDGKEIVALSTMNFPLSHGINPLFEKLDSPKEFIGVGHRFVHGGDRFVSTVVVTPTIMDELDRLTELAPLHNPQCLEGIKESLKWGPDIPQVAVFDTAFHHSLPTVASLYAIDPDLANRYHIKRYGFHGIANAFVWDRFQQVEGSSKQRAIAMHLGNGCSITAIREGLSVDTSMGFSPLEGLVMGTRSGDIDPAVVPFLSRQEHLSAEEVIDFLNFRSGLLGVSGLSSDMVTLLGSQRDSERVKFAVDLFCYRIVKYLGAYLAALGGADAFLFSGGIGENAAEIRSKILKQMEWIGVRIDEQANRLAVSLSPGSIAKISSSTSSITVYVIASDENTWIAQELVKHI